MATIIFRKLLARVQVRPRGWVLVIDPDGDYVSYGRPYGVFEKQRELKVSGTS